ncbi:MAG: hypothetical protein ACK42D_01145 [Candidatus Paceibacteria bacterium]
MPSLQHQSHFFSLRTILITVAVFGGGMLLLAYLVFQARFLLQGPVITLTSEPNTVQDERVVMLTGSVKNITRLTLNGRQIFTNELGYFDEALVLENGYTIATLAATDRYGRETNVTRPFVYQQNETADTLFD